MDLLGRSDLKSPLEGKISKSARLSIPDLIDQAISSPLNTPKTSRAASKLGIPSDISKALLKYASMLNPLVGMIYAKTRYFIEKNEDIPSREEFLPILVDCVNSFVHSPISSHLLLGYGTPRQKVVFGINARRDHVNMEF